MEDRWEEGIYCVLHKKEGLPVYTVQQEGGVGPVRTLHRNLLLPVGALDSEGEAEEEKIRATPTSNKPVPAKRRQQKIPPVEAETDDKEERVFKVTVEIVPDNRLRPNAPEFVPKDTMCRANIEEDGEREQTDVEENDMLESDSVTNKEIGDEESESTSMSAEASESEDTIDLEDPKPSQATEFFSVRPSPVPRRSLRQPKPVQRLNLTHQCRSDPWLNRPLIESAIISLKSILCQPMADVQGTDLNTILYHCSCISMVSCMQH